MFVPEHIARASPHPHAWIAQCACGWLGSDQGTEEAARVEAEQHERGEHPPWQPLETREWTPDQHPTPKT